MISYRLFSKTILNNTKLKCCLFSHYDLICGRLVPFCVSIMAKYYAFSRAIHDFRYALKSIDQITSDEIADNSQNSTAALLKFGNGKVFFPTLHWAYDYLSMLGLKLTHINERGSRSCSISRYKHYGLTTLTTRAIRVPLMTMLSTLEAVMRWSNIPGHLWIPEC